MSSKVPISPSSPSAGVKGSTHAFPEGSGFPNSGPCTYGKSTILSPEPIKLFSRGKNMCTLKFEKAYFYLFIDFLLLIPIWDFLYYPILLSFLRIYIQSYLF